MTEVGDKEIHSEHGVYKQEFTVRKFLLSKLLLRRA
jgi:hypothetical protein